MAVNPTDMEILQDAEEWDTGIRIGLAAWTDALFPTAMASVQPGANDPMALNLMEQQRRFVAQRMVTHCSKSLMHRTLLTMQLQRMQREVAFRWSWEGADKWTRNEKADFIRG